MLINEYVFVVKTNIKANRFCTYFYEKSCDSLWFFRDRKSCDSLLLFREISHILLVFRRVFGKTWYESLNSDTVLLYFCLRYENIFLKHFILTQHVDKQQESIVSSANMFYKNQSCWKCPP
jgi:hypothetical protein